MSFVTFYSADPLTGKARGVVLGFETPLLPRPAIVKWARANVGGWWRLKKCGEEFYDHQLWELRRWGRPAGRGKRGPGRHKVMWKVITTMRLQRSKLRVPVAV